MVTIIVAAALAGVVAAAVRATPGRSSRRGSCDRRPVRTDATRQDASTLNDVPFVAVAGCGANGPRATTTDDEGTAQRL